MDIVQMLRILKRYRWPLAILSVILFYTIAGFLLVPFGLKAYITGTLAKQWQHGVTVKDIQFNPYRLYLQVDGFAVADNDGSPLLALEQLRFDYEALSVFRGEIGVEQFSIENPFIKFEADGKGSYTVLAMLSTGESATPNPDVVDKETARIVPLLLREVSMRKGTILYRDPGRAGGFEQEIYLPALSVVDFHTRKTASGNHVVLSLDNQKGATLDIDANVRLEPLRINGKFELNHLNLAPIWQLMANPVNFELKPPILDLSGQIDLTLVEPMILRLTGGTLQLTDLAIAGRNLPDQPQIRLPALAVRDIAVSLPEQQVTVGSVLASDGWANVMLARDGSSNLAQLFTVPQQAAAPTSPTSQPPSGAEAPEKPWDVTLRQLSVSGFAIQLTDEHPSQPLMVDIRPINITIADWKPLAADPFTIQLRTGIAGRGSEPSAHLSVDTRLQVSPLSAQSHLDLQGLPLAMLQPYVQDAVRANINAGTASAVMDLAITQPDSLGLVADGSVRVDGLDIHQQGSDKKLLSWEAFGLEGIHYDLAANTLSLAQVSVSKLNSSFTINTDGTTNVQDLMVPQPESPPSSRPMTMQIGKIILEDADLGFADLTMKPNFRVAMKQLSGSIDGLSSGPATIARIDLKGKVDRYAPVTIKGKMNPLREKPMLDARMAFRNLELTTFTPYSGTYAGFKIDRGQLSLDIDYQMVDNRIQGKNHIVMNQLQLGETVQSDKAVSLPLRLAIALLRDEKGVIDLGFEVKGDLNDPQFSISGILWKVLSNMVMKVVTSPFSLVSGLMGGQDAEGIDRIGFAAGDDVVNDMATAKLGKAAELMSRRAGLHVNILGNILPEQDRPALQHQRLLSTLVQQDKDVLPEAFASGAAALDNGAAYKVLARYYKKQRSDELGDVADRIRDEMKSRGEKPERAQLKQLAYEQAWQRLREDVPVTDEELRQLAMQRARNIKAVLVEKMGIAAERVFVTDANTDPEKASLESQLTLDAD